MSLPSFSLLWQSVAHFPYFLTVISDSFSGMCARGKTKSGVTRDSGHIVYLTRNKFIPSQVFSGLNQVH